MAILDPRQYVGLAGVSAEDEWETVQEDSEWETVDVDVDASTRNPHFSPHPLPKARTALGDVPIQAPKEVGETYFRGARAGLQNIGDLGPGLVKSAPILGRSVVAGGLRQWEQTGGEPGESYTLTRIEEANRQAVRDLPKGTQRLVGETMQSIGESAAPMVGMGLAGAGGAAVGGPVAGYGAAAATGVAMNFNAEKNRSLREIKMHLDDISFNARGHGLTGNEWAVVQEKVDNATDMKALAEGVFETAGDLASFGLFRAATATKAGEQAVNRFTDWVAKQPALNRYFIGTISGAPAELATETMTQDVQSQQDYLLGARDKPSTTAESFQEIAPQTLLQTFLMGAGGSVVDAGMNKYRETQAERNPPRDASSIPQPSMEKPGANPQAGQAGGVPQTSYIINNLVADFGLTPEQAAGVAGNFAHETGDFKHMQEIKPAVEGSRGGFGWAQWTGQRRKAFESWADANGLDPASDEANYGFLKHELETDYADVVENLRSAKNPAQAAVAFEKGYEKAGVKAYKSRIAKANAALAAHQAGEPFPATPVQEQVLRDEPDETESEFEAFNRRVLERARKRRQQPEVQDEEAKEGQAETTDAVLAEDERLQPSDSKSAAPPVEEELRGPALAESFGTARQDGGQAGDSGGAGISDNAALQDQTNRLPEGYDHRTAGPVGQATSAGGPSLNQRFAIEGKGNGRASVAEVSEIPKESAAEYLSLGGKQAEGDRWAFFNRLSVPPESRKKGFGSELLRQMTDWADNNQVGIVNEVSPYGDMDITQLTKLYQDHGFEPVVDGIMVRTPKVAAAHTATAGAAKSNTPTASTYPGDVSKKVANIDIHDASGLVSKKAPEISAKLTPAKDTSQEDLNYIAGAAATTNEKGFESRLNGRFGRQRVLQWKNAGLLQQWGREATGANQFAPAQADQPGVATVKPPYQGERGPTSGENALTDSFSATTTAQFDIEALLNDPGLKNLSVKVKAVIEETGQTVTMEEKADEAIREVRDRIEKLKQLRDCVMT